MGESRRSAGVRDDCDANLYLSNALLFGTSARGEVAESHDLALTSCGLPAADLNQAYLKRPEGDVPAALERARAWFAPRGLPWVACVRDDREGACAAALADAGFERVGDVPGMALAPLRDGAPPRDDLEIRAVRSPADLEAFQRTAFEGFGYPSALGPLFLTETLRRRPGVELYLGLVDGTPAATSLLAATGHVAGIYYVATLEPHRRRGLGEALTWAAVRGGLQRGCRIASLQASRLGEPVYARMGFATVLRYAKYRLREDSREAGGGR